MAETWPQLERAAECRYWDALNLACAECDRSTGAIYLMGYVVEILLKVAYFRLEQVQPVDDVSRFRRQARGLWLRMSATTALPRNDHDLAYWLDVVEYSRVHRQMAVDPVAFGLLRGQILQLSALWSEALRYSDARMSDAEVAGAFGAVETFVTKSRVLWS